MSTNLENLAVATGLSFQWKRSFIPIPRKVSVKECINYHTIALNLHASKVILIGRTDAETEAQIPWPHDAKSQLTVKDPDAGKDWGLEKKGATEDEMVGWHHWLNGHEFEETPGDSEEQGSLACCSPGGCKESDKTEQLSRNNKVMLKILQARFQQ